MSTMNGKRKSSEEASSLPRKKRHAPSKSPKEEPKGLATTFGVEFEFIFAFHESQLQRVLTKYKIDAEIIKDPAQINHESLLDPIDFPSHARRTRWPEWVLKVGEDDECISDELITPGVPAYEYQEDLYRPYLLEPLLIAQSALAAANCSASVVGDTNDYPNPSPALLSGQVAHDICVGRADLDFQKWNLTNDRSLIGATKGELRTKLGWLVNEHNQNEWDNHGVELVSPVFAYSDRLNACKEIHKHLTALTHKFSTPPSSASNSPSKPLFPVDAKYGAFDSVWAGTHIHVGFDAENPADISLPFLQHLVFILLVNEPLISKLHPRYRSGIGSIVYFTRSGRRKASPKNMTLEEKEQHYQREEEEIVRKLTEHHSYTHEVKSNRDIFIAMMFDSYPTPSPALYRIARLIFDPSITIKDLGEMVGIQRNCIVNYINLFNFCNGKPTKKATIEFRQHSCTLDATETKHWVEFLFAIMHMAERFAAEILVSHPTVHDSTATIDNSSLIINSSNMGTDESNQMYENDLDETLDDSNATTDGFPNFAYMKDLRKYNVNAKSETMCSSIEELCGEKFLGLPEEEIQYWKLRQDRIAAMFPKNPISSGYTRSSSWIKEKRSQQALEGLEQERMENLQNLEGEYEEDLFAAKDDEDERGGNWGRNIRYFHQS